MHLFRCNICVTHKRLRIRDPRSFDGDDVGVLQLPQQLNLVQDFLLGKLLAVVGLLDHDDMEEAHVGGVDVRFIAAGEKLNKFEVLSVDGRGDIHSIV